MKTLDYFEPLAKCSKRTLSNGEKNLFKGYMNRWTKLQDWRFGEKSWKQFVFVYKQPIKYWYDQIPEELVHTMSRRQKIHYCIQEELWEQPIHAYDQRYLVFHLVEYKENDLLLRVLSGEDSIDYNVSMLVKSLNRPVSIIICTGRDVSCKQETLDWLYRHYIEIDPDSYNFIGIMFRKENDTRPDWVVKEEMWREIAKSHYIVALLDDRLQVVRRARALGLKVFNVEYNNF